MKRLFLKSYFCRLKKKFIGEAISTQEKARTNEFIVVSAITFCGDYDDIYRRIYWNIHGRKEFVWRCATRIEQGPEVCKNRTVKEDELYDTVMTTIDKLLAGDNNMIKTLEENIHAVIGQMTEHQISEINNLLEEKQKELIKLANKGQDCEHLADEIDELRDKRQLLLVDQRSITATNRSTVCTYMGFFDEIRKVFAAEHDVNADCFHLIA